MNECKDAAGQVLKVGDKVCHFSRSGSSMYSSMRTIQKIRSHSKTYHWGVHKGESYNVYQIFYETSRWAQPDRCVKVNL